jgi:hypothetical protein
VRARRSAKETVIGEQQTGRGVTEADQLRSGAGQLEANDANGVEAVLVPFHDGPS